jgi:redox-sensitive bicupin YhaK (pirin superfamily)
MPELRPVADVTRHPRLPVWPVAAGLSSWASELVGLRRLAGALEDRWGGRVQPMQLPARTDPFLMLVHHRHTFSRWDPLRPLSALVMPEGFPAHPHRGFETVTFVLEGGMRHRDSSGVKMTYRAGSAQWLTAGRGVLHEEMWATELPTHELYQLWINLPRAHKWDAPEIQLLGDSDVQGGSPSRAPLPVSTIDSVRVTVLAGTCRGLRSPIHTRSPLAVVRLEWDAPGPFAWPEVPADHTALCFVRRGAVTIAGRPVRATELATLDRGNTWAPGLSLEATEPGTDVLWMTGAPLGEPVVMGGSMVMNTEREVAEAHRDYQAGLFGAGWSPTASDEEWARSWKAARP